MSEDGAERGSETPGMRALEVDAAGLFCPEGGFHVDPHRGVEVAVITHAHADHCRPATRVCHVAASAVELVRRRVGAETTIVPHPFGEPFRLGEATVSLHPAGHILGSAQVRIEAAGEVCVVSGDYRRQTDGAAEPFEPVPCEVFVSEATFALPVFRWSDPEDVFAEIAAWWRENAARGQNSVLFAYALGKAQRILHGLSGRIDREILLHGAVLPFAEAYLRAGVPLAPFRALPDLPRGAKLAGELVIAPPQAAGTAWLRRLEPCATAFASGWMRIRGLGRRRNVDRGFVLSDHADWPALLATVRETGAREVVTTHGYAGTFARFLEDAGIRARPLPLFAAGGDED